MAASETIVATATAASSPPKLPPPPPGEQSPSNMSSPLTEVEDKDGDPDDMDVDDILHHSPLGNSDRPPANNGDASRTATGPPLSDNDEDSALSEADPDMNDSEAETERLYDTPVKTKNIKDDAGPDSSPELSPSRRLAPAHSRERNFQASPSKLKQQLRVDGADERSNGNRNGRVHGATSADDDDDELSELDMENEADGEEETAAENGSPRPKNGAKETTKKTDDDAAVKEETQAAPVSAHSQRPNADTRKRKRSPTTDPSESDQPLRKRTGPGANGNHETDGAADGTATPPSAANTSINGTKKAEAEGESDNDAKADHAQGDTPDEAGSDALQTRRTRGAGAKKSKDGEDEDADEDTLEDGEAAPAEDDGAEAADDGHAAEVDEEAEAAHRNEEELERKKAAFEQLQAIERRFASFRDKLYQERLDQLNAEEAMLRGDNPTHPEYLAMLQSVDARRDEKIRVSALEYHFSMKTLRLWAVGRRSQIHTQYFQNVRESRELVLEELGRQWYQIQHQRRRHANAIPDYGLRFPAAPVQRTKDAIAYNKEVSILSGVAKYEGFPAAPHIRGASSGQVDEDLGAIARARLGTYADGSSSLRPNGNTHGANGLSNQQYMADAWAITQPPGLSLHPQSLPPLPPLPPPPPPPPSADGPRNHSGHSHSHHNHAATATTAAPNHGARHHHHMHPSDPPATGVPSKREPAVLSL